MNWLDDPQAGRDVAVRLRPFADVVKEQDEEENLGTLQLRENFAEIGHPARVGSVSFRNGVAAVFGFSAPTGARANA